MPLLSRLNIYDNQITDLAPLAASPLATLSAGFNRIDHLPAFTNVAALTSLNLWHNELADFSSRRRGGVAGVR